MGSSPTAEVPRYRGCQRGPSEEINIRHIHMARRQCIGTLPPGGFYFLADSGPSQLDLTVGTQALGNDLI